MARLWEGLRDAEPAASLGQRIITTMEAHEVRPSKPIWGLAMAATAVCAVALTIWFRVTIQVHQPVHIPVAVTAARSVPARPADTPVSARRLRRNNSRPAEKRQVNSYPAPSLPLSEQERLLLRLAHRNDAMATAVLNPALQAAQSAKATEQFQAFFAMDPKEMKREME